MKRLKLVTAPIIFAFVFSLFAFAVQPVNGASVDAAGLKQLFDQLDKQSRWDSYKTKTDDSLIAWDQSYVMRAYLVMYESTKDKKYLDAFVGHADSALQRRDSVRGVKDYRGLSLPAWRSGKYTNYTEYRIYAVQTGLTAAPLAQFAVLVKKDTALAQYETKANAYLQAAKDAINVHDMSDRPQYLDIESRWYDDGTNRNLDRPLNMNLAQGTTMLAIYEASGDKAYLDKATKIANYFKKFLNVNSSTNSYVWNYYPEDDQYSKTIEDLNHSVYDLEFVNWAYRNGIFTSSEMQKFANTGSKVMVKSDGSIANRVDGSGTGDTPGWFSIWLYFEKWDSSLFDTAYRILSAKTSVTPKELFGVALLNYSYALDNGTTPAPDPGSGGGTTPTPDPGTGDGTTPSPSGNLVANGDFSGGTSGWVNNSGAGTINTSGSNKYLTNTYNFNFYQEINLKPGTYYLNAKTRQSSSAKGTRIVVQFRDSSGNKTVPYDIKHTNSGTGWESIPETTLQVPSSAVITRIYLLAVSDTGAQDFDDISIIAKDAAGGNPPAPAPDTQSPAVTLTSPSSGSALKGQVAMQITSSDNVGVSKVDVAYATDPAGQWTSAGPAALTGGTEESGTWGLSWDVSGLASDSYYVRATARDAAGNSTQSGVVTYKVNPDTQAPAVSVTGPATDSELKGQVALQITSSDNVGVSKVDVAYTTNPAGQWTSAGSATLSGGTDKSGTWGLGWDVSKLASGTYSVRATAWDAAGNKTDSSVVTYKINVQPAPPANLIKNGDFSAGVTGWASRNGAGTIRSSNNDKYLSNTYNFDFYQDLSLAPGTYKLSAITKKGTSGADARIVVQFRDGSGNKTNPYSIKYNNTGSGWEAIPATTIKVTSGVELVRIYVLAGSGTQYFDNFILTLEN